jgi:molybdopterin/thiamine biosynthesis adenylyltransferase/molybdopterin converting factor small subunit
MTEMNSATHTHSEDTMAVSVYVPSPFRRLTGSRSQVEGHGKDVAELLEDLERQFPGFRNLLFNGENEIPAHINIYVNNREISTLEGTATPLRDGDQVAVIPALAGGEGDGEGPARAPWALTEQQVLRYSRHIIMPQVGSVGQRKLMEARVLVLGAGGLGSPAALYLALAGVGTLGIVDFDAVDLSNLQRQILHRTEDVGRLKVESARETISARNPDVRVVPHNVALTSENALDIISQYDIVVNGMDNFPARYLTNDACVFLKKPLVDGSVLLFDGQATVFLPGKGCYRCLYPTPPPPGLVPSCAEAGVLGALPGVIGCIQAIETIKLILGVGESLSGRLLLFDALSMEWRSVRIHRDPDCAVCGDHPTVTELIDYEEFCGFPGGSHAAAGLPAGQAGSADPQP